MFFVYVDTNAAKHNRAVGSNERPAINVRSDDDTVRYKCFEVALAGGVVLKSDAASFRRGIPASVWLECSAVRPIGDVEDWTDR